MQINHDDTVHSARLVVQRHQSGPYTLTHTLTLKQLSISFISSAAVAAAAAAATAAVHSVVSVSVPLLSVSLFFNR